MTIFTYFLSQIYEQMIDLILHNVHKIMRLGRYHKSWEFRGQYTD